MLFNADTNGRVQCISASCDRIEQRPPRKVHHTYCASESQDTRIQERLAGRRLLNEAPKPSDHGLHTPSNDINPSAAKVCVKAENLRLFAAMFPDGKEQTLRQFSWKHFLQAMVDAGFSVTQCSGSAVSFRANNQAIVFHQPHPETTIDPVILLSMGKRLRKWFGWSSDTFELSGKDSAPS
jgi:hypothetical protein